MVKNILIWGTEVKARKLINYLDLEKVEIVAFTDNQCTKHYNLWKSIECVPKYEALALNYDYIVIASAAYDEITGFLMSVGVKKEKIVQAYNASHLIPNTLFFFDSIDLCKDKLEIFTSIDCMVWM